MQITFIRHLPTEWNKRTILQGKRDIPLATLTNEDVDDMQANQHYLEKISPFDIVLASSLQRTRQTAIQYGYKVIVDQLLDEYDFGKFEGVPRKILYKTLGDQWFNHPKSITLGESMKNLENRIIKFLNKYSSFANILVFGHGTWMRAFIAHAVYGNLNKMNQLTVRNNDCVTLSSLPYGRTVPLNP